MDSTIAKNFINGRKRLQGDIFLRFSLTASDNQLIFEDLSKAQVEDGVPYSETIIYDAGESSNCGRIELSIVEYNQMYLHWDEIMEVLRNGVHTMTEGTFAAENGKRCINAEEGTKTFTLLKPGWHMQRYQRNPGDDECGLTVRRCIDLIVDDGSASLVPAIIIRRIEYEEETLDSLPETRHPQQAPPIGLREMIESAAAGKLRSSYTGAAAATIGKVVVKAEIKLYERYGVRKLDDVLLMIKKANEQLFPGKIYRSW
jgi:hypothetical protein